MTIDKSLKVRKGISRSRNVLTRAERIEKLLQQDRWTEENGPFALPKVRVYKIVVKKKKKTKGDEEGAAEDASKQTAAKTPAAGAKAPAAAKASAAPKKK